MPSSLNKLKPVIYIPGFPSSELFGPTRSGKTERIFPDFLDILKYDYMLKGPDSPSIKDGVTAGEPISSYLGNEYADNLYQVLNSLGYETPTNKKGSIPVSPVGWDWRLPVDAIVTHNKVIKAINTSYVNSNNQKVVVLVHSTGGLVLRTLIENNPLFSKIRDKIEHVICFAVPWLGLLKSLRAVEPGLTLFDIATGDKSQLIMAHAHSAYDLFPIEESGQFYDRNGDANSPLNTSYWIRNRPRGIEHVIRKRIESANNRFIGRENSIQVNGALPFEFTNIVGYGVKTDATAKFQRFGLDNLRWGANKKGDGTVQAKSAGALNGNGVRRLYTPLGKFHDNIKALKHDAIFVSPVSQQVLAEICTGASPKPFYYAAYNGTYRRKLIINVLFADKNGFAVDNIEVYVQTSATGSRRFLMINMKESLGRVEIPIRYLRDIIGTGVKVKIAVFFKDPNGFAVSRDIIISSSNLRL